MANKSYQKIISTSLEKYIWFFLLGTLLNPLFRIVIFMFQIFYVLKGKREGSNVRHIPLDPTNTIFAIAISLVTLILWVLIKINMKQQNKSSSVFLDSLFKVMLLINAIFMIIHFFNILYMYFLIDIRLPYLGLLSNLSYFACGLIVIIFLIIVVRSYSRIILYSRLIVFKIIAITILSAHIIVVIFSIFRSLDSNIFQRDFLLYSYSFVIISSSVISIFMSIIWILWINKYVTVYKTMVSSNETLLFEKEESSIIIYNQRRVNNSLKKYGIIIIATAAMIVRLVVIIRELMGLFSTMDTKYIIYTLFVSNPSMIFIFIEGIIYLWIAILVLSSSRKHTMTPLISLFIVYCLTFFQTIMMYIYIQVRYVNHSFHDYDNLYFHLIPLLGILVFISMVIWRYCKVIKPQIINRVCTGFIITLICNFIFSIVNLNSVKIYTFLNLTIFPVIRNNKNLILILDTVISGFWILFSIFYCQELDLDYGNDIE